MLVNRRGIASEEMLAQINAVSAQPTNAGNRTQCGTSLSILVGLYASLGTIPNITYAFRESLEQHIEAVKKI